MTQLPLFVYLTLGLILATWLIAEFRANARWRIPLGLTLMIGAHALGRFEGMIHLATTNVCWSHSVESLLATIDTQLTSERETKLRSALREMLTEVDPPGWNSQASKFEAAVYRFQATVTQSPRPQ